MTDQLLAYGIQAVITLTTAFGGVKVGLNGLEKRIDKVEKKVDRMIETDSDMAATIAVIRDRQERDES